MQNVWQFDIFLSASFKENILFFNSTTRLAGLILMQTNVIHISIESTVWLQRSREVFEAV